MVRICKNCGFENQDSYDFCAKCGTPLVEGLQPNTFFVYRNVEQGISRKFIIISYIITIFFSFGGFFMDLVARNTSMGFFSFFGFFMPFSFLYHAAAGADAFVPRINSPPRILQLPEPSGRNGWRSHRYWPGIPGRGTFQARCLSPVRPG